MRIKGRIYVPRTGDVTRLIMEEAHSLRYFIHPESTKMYCDLKQVSYEEGHSRFCVAVFELSASDV